MTLLLVRLCLLLHLVFLFPAIGSAQKSSEGDNFLGETIRGSYQNKFFGFKLSFDPEMYVLSDAEKSAYKKAGLEMIVSGVKENREAYAKAASQEVLLFSLAVSELKGAPVSSLNIGGLKQPKGATSSEVCDVAAGFFLKNPKFALLTKTASKKIASKEFSWTELQFNTGAQPLKLRYYATIQKGYSITFVISYLSEEDLASLEKVLGSLDFENPV